MATNDSDNQAFWAAAEPTVAAMVGGDQDAFADECAASRAFLDAHSAGRDAALDIACGMGRMTRGLLLPMFAAQASAAVGDRGDVFCARIKDDCDAYTRTYDVV